MRNFLKTYRRKIILGVVGVVFLAALPYLLRTPSNERDWTVDQAVLSSAVFTGDTVRVSNIRNFSYTTTATYTPAYYDKTFNLGEISSLDYIVEPLGTQGVAHTFLSFGFTNGDYLSISVEIRKEKGESFSPWRGLVRAYELTYVVADERDVVKLRTNYRKDPVFVYPMKLHGDERRTLFVDMLTRANALREKPEFYNTLTSTCITNIADHINKINPNAISWDLRILLPRDSDLYFYELGLIDTTVLQDALRATYHINALAETHATDPNFSQLIRSERP